MTAFSLNTAVPSTFHCLNSEYIPDSKVLTRAAVPRYGEQPVQPRRAGRDRERADSRDEARAPAAAAHARERHGLLPHPHAPQPARRSLLLAGQSAQPSAFSLLPLEICCSQITSACLSGGLCLEFCHQVASVVFLLLGFYIYVCVCIISEDYEKVSLSSFENILGLLNSVTCRIQGRREVQEPRHEVSGPD